MIALDRRKFALLVARDIERTQSQPVNLSVIQSGKHQAESQVGYLEGLLEVATPEQRPALEADIARYRALSARCATELATRRDELNVQQVPPKTQGPNKPHSIPTARNLVDPETPAVPETPGLTAAALMPSGEGGSRHPNSPTSHLEHQAAPVVAEVGRASGRGPQPRDLRANRLAILKAFKRKEKLDGMDAVSRRLQCSRTQLYGMVRGDTHRYNDDRLDAVLGKLECTRAHWDNKSPLTSGA